MNIGTRFIKSAERPYTEDGAKGLHCTEVMYEVTSTDRGGFEAKAVEVVSESGRPSFAGNPLGVSMAWFGWEAALARGDVREV